jgi:hypothetical protein
VQSARVGELYDEVVIEEVVGDYVKVVRGEGVSRWYHWDILKHDIVVHLPPRAALSP